MIKIAPTHKVAGQIAEALGLSTDSITRIVIDIDASKPFVTAYVQETVCDEGMCTICDLIKSWRENGLPSE